MKVHTMFLTGSFLLLLSCYGICQKNSSQLVGGGCDGCSAMYEGMPKVLSWQTVIPDSNEPGEPMEISGRIFMLDGKTPAPDVILYVYHTDAQGYYSPKQGQTGGARRHGHLRGWMKTDATGKYKFMTIKPASYPRASIPAHVHSIIKERDKNEYYIDEYLFEKDPFLTNNERSKAPHRGGSGIITLTKDKDGVWRGKRDIILGLNIPNYR